MIPREPAKRPQVGFLYLHPIRIQGLSVAGEESVVQVPELDVCFDIGRGPRFALTSPYVALSHGHMDHAAGLAYYFSQRQFQGMGVGTVVCHPGLEQPIHNIMKAWVDLEGQRTQYQVAPLEPEAELEIKNRTYLRAFDSVHTDTSLGYVVLERRSKLKPEFVGCPEAKLMDLKKSGQEITQIVEIPLVAFTGDTMWGPLFDRPDLLNAKVLITECTFLHPDHRSRASIGKHLHLDDILRLLDRSTAQAVVLTHMSRRINIVEIRKQIDAKIPRQHRDRVHVLMDRRANRQLYEKQLRRVQEQGQPETAKAPTTPSATP